jgi:hypothetical protein
MLKPFSALLILLAPSTLLAQTMSIKTTEGLVTTDSTTLFAFNKELKQLERIDLLSAQNSQLVLPDNAIGFDVATLANTNDKQALVVASDGIYKADKEKPSLLFAYTSVINQLEVTEFEKINFIIDANKDGLSDILLPDLNQTTLYIQTNNGQFTPHTFEKKTQFTGDFSKDGLTLEVDINNQPTITDFNHDGLNDLVFLNKKGADVLYANTNGYNKIMADVNFNIELGELSNGEKRKIKQLLDINNDGYLDFITKQYKPVEGMDSLDIDIAHNLYLGNKTGFSQTPIKLLNTSGPSQLVFETDFNNDGLIDLQTMDLDIGLGTIASMAMGGGKTDVDVEMNIYKQQTDGSFASKSSIEIDLEMEINMSNGDATPPLYIGDINGDDKTDAVYKYSKKTLYVYYGEENNLLNKKRKKIKLTLPKKSKDILLVDINQDGKKDFVFKFTEEDGTSKIKTRLN